MIKYVMALIVVALGLPMHFAQALPEDSEQPIYISSNSAIKDEKQGFTVYEGDVEMQQGTLNIQGDKVTIYLENEQVSRIIAEGNPARFKQKPEPDKGDVSAKAMTIEYDISQKTIDLTNQATLDRDGSTITGNKIQYDMTASRVEAGSDSGRVNVVIPPQKSQ